MAADEADIVAERQQLVLDRLDQGGVIAAGNVASADRALEQHVAHMGEALLRVEEGDAARRMARAMKDVEGELAEATRSPSLSQRSGANRAFVHAVFRAAFRPGFRRRTSAVRTRICTLSARAIPRRRRLIDMAVGQPDFLTATPACLIARDVGKSPPGSITTAFLVASPHNNVQFC